MMSKASLASRFSTLFQHSQIREDAKKVCAIKLSQIIGGDSNSAVVKQACDCIVDKVSLDEINSKGVLKANKTITNECIGN